MRSLAGWLHPTLVHWLRADPPSFRHSLHLQHQRLSEDHGPVASMSVTPAGAIAECCPARSCPKFQGHSQLFASGSSWTEFRTSTPPWGF